MHLDAMLHQGVDLPLDAVLPGCYAECLPVWDAAVGSTAPVCETWGQDVPNPVGHHWLETTSQANVKAVQNTPLTGEAAANVCFRNRGLASLPHAQNMAGTSQITILVLWEPMMFYEN